MEKAHKKRVIEKVIITKMEEWLKSITDEKVRKIAKENYIVTGGAIASMLQGEMPNDFDVYFKTSESCKSVADYYISKLKLKNPRISRLESVIDVDRVKIIIKSAGIAAEGDSGEDYKYFEGGGDISKFLSKISKKERGNPYHVAMMTDNAISLSDDVQIITRFTGCPEEIHKNYDFVHTTNYFTPETGLVLNMDAVMAAVTKELKYVGSKYPICSLFRMRKFLKRDYTITAGEILKISWDISKLDLTDRHVLQEQLVGVDQAYFQEIFGILNKEIDKEIDRTYLFNIVNKVFDDFGDSDIANGLLTPHAIQNGAFGVSQDLDIEEE